MNRIILFFVTLLFIAYINAESLHFNNYSGFGKYGKHPQSYILDESLIIENNDCNNIYNIANLNISTNSFNYKIKIANLNNLENKKYKYTDETGRSISLNNPKYGIVWDYIDSDNYTKLDIQSVDSGLNDFLYQRSVQLKITKFTNKIPSIIFSKEYESGINMYSKFNTISLKYSNEYMSIYIGYKNPIFVTSYKTDLTSYNIGYFCGPASKIAVKDISVKYTQNRATYLATNWSLDSINSYLNKSNDLLEGIWSVLDSNLNEKEFALGGKYKFAIIRNNDNYDIIYISGAKINSDSWKTGMIKGKIIKTDFDNNYNLIWYYPNMDKSDDGLYLVFNNTNILELYFSNNNLIRLHKAKRATNL